jgi:hypothetical protein
LDGRVRCEDERSCWRSFHLIFSVVPSLLVCVSRSGVSLSFPFSWSLNLFSWLLTRAGTQAVVCVCGGLFPGSL